MSTRSVQIRGLLNDDNPYPRYLYLNNDANGETKSLICLDGHELVAVRSLIESDTGKHEREFVIMKGSSVVTSFSVIERPDREAVVSKGSVSTAIELMKELGRSSANV